MNGYHFCRHCGLKTLNDRPHPLLAMILCDDCFDELDDRVNNLLQEFNEEGIHN